MVHDNKSTKISDATFAARKMVQAMLDAPFHISYFKVMYSSWKMEERYAFIEALAQMKTDRDYCPICALKNYKVDLALCVCDRIVVKPAVVINLVFRENEKRLEYEAKRAKLENEIAAQSLRVEKPLPEYRAALSAWANGDDRVEKAMDSEVKLHPFVGDLTEDEEKKIENVVATVDDPVQPVKAIVVGFYNGIDMDSNDENVSLVDQAKLAGSFNIKSDLTVGVTYVAYPGRLDLPLILPPTPFNRDYGLDQCTDACCTDQYLIGEVREEFSLSYCKKSESNYKVRSNIYHCGSRDGSLLSVFSFRTWAKRRGFLEVRAKDANGRDIYYYEKGNFRSPIYPYDLVATFQALSDMAVNNQNVPWMKAMRIGYEDDRFRFSVFLYALKWMLNSVTLDGRIRSASCGELGRIIDVDKLYRYATTAPREELRAYFTILLHCDTLEDIYYNVCGNAYGIPQMLMTLERKPRGVFHTVDVDQVCDLLGRRPACKSGIGCFGFMGRDYRWNSLKINRKVPHVSVAAYLNWEMVLDCSLLHGVIGSGVIKKPGSFSFSVPSMYEGWSLLISQFKYSDLVRDYYVRLRDYYDSGNIRPKLFRLLLVNKEDVPFYLKQ